jgi:5-phospho-D-xylono-1,4-lactonase
MGIRTVLGEIDPSACGMTACHEHLLWTVPEPYQEEDADLGFDSTPAAVSEVKHYQTAGGNSIVDMTTAEIGRRPQELHQIAQITGLHIIAATGHHKEKFSAKALASKTIDEIAERIVMDITQGMDSTSIQAGVIKAATSADSASESERRVIKAAGIAHAETGAPVSTHTEGGTFALEQAELLLNAGIPPEKILVGHLDRGLPTRKYLELAEKGIYLGFDQVGKEKYWPDAARVELVKMLVNMGYARQILFSGDTARKSSWHTYNPQTHGMAHLCVNFIPALKKAGIREEEIEVMFVKNPCRFLDF